MANILLVEDDEYLRSAIKHALERERHSIIEAPNGRSAKDILGTQKFDAIISDIQMPHFNGVELLEWVKVHCPTPVLLMTGFSNLLEVKSAYELGAKEFLTKPFENAELIKALNTIIEVPKPDTETDKEESEPEYCKVSITEFVARPKIDFDVYVKLSGKKFIKIGHAGSELPKEQIEKYRSHGLKFLYICRTDFSKLVGFNLELGKVLKNSASVSPEKKLNFMKYTGEVILENAFINGVDKECFDEAKDFLSMTVSAIGESSECYNMLNLLNNHSDYIYAHSVGVSMYSIMIARKMGFESQQTFFKLSMSGLFIDIGKKEIEREVLDKARPLLTVAERKLIESHPVRGRDILLELKGIPQDIVQIVYEHHEDCVGQGYPRAISNRDAHPLSAIIQLADIFVENTLKGPNSLGRTPKESIKHIETVYLERVNKKALLALKEIFNM